MNWLDVAVVVIVALSVLFAFVRGIVRTLVALVAWIVGLVLALAFASPLAAHLPTFGLATDTAVPVSQLVAFALIFVGAMICGALITWPLAGIVKAAGLSFVDRFLGGLFGVVRAGALLAALGLVAGVSGLAQRDWWQNSASGPVLARLATAIAPWLPPGWAGQPDFSAPGKPAGA
jgi:membrane protein required for colicin V production